MLTTRCSPRHGNDASREIQIEKLNKPVTKGMTRASAVTLQLNVRMRPFRRD
jgi:hypothetical protein